MALESSMRHEAMRREHPVRAGELALPPWGRRAAVVAALALLVAVAYAPLRDAGFVGADWRILVAASGASGADLLDARTLFELGGPGGSILTGAWTAASRQVWGVEGEGAAAALPYRLENLAMLLAGAAGIALFLRRLLLPWTGSEHARAAAFGALALLAIHPLYTAVVAGLAHRDALLAAAWSAWAAAAFLGGRQERRPVRGVVAGALAIAAGLSGELAYGLPLVLALAELVSAHRYRPRRDRVRTAATTLVVYGACVLVGPLARYAVDGAWPVPSALATLERVGDDEGLAVVIALFVEKLGVLVLPVNEHGTGLSGLALAGLAFLVALQPAMAAARSAPRLWGGLLVAWFSALVVAVVLAGIAARVHPGDLSEAHVLFGAAGVMAMGLAVPACAVSGLRRTALPLAIGLVYAILASGNARAWRAAADAVADLRGDLAAARAELGPDVTVLVVDPPGLVRGIECLGGALPLLAPGGAPVRAISREALLALALEPELDALRAAGCAALVARASLVDALPPPTGVSDGDGSVVEAAGARPQVPADRVLCRLDPPERSGGPLRWRGEARSPDLDLECAGVDGLRVVAPAGTDLAAARVVSWAATSPAAALGAHAGVWLSLGERPVAVYDLASSLAWRIGGRARRVWFESGLPTVEEAEVLETLPPFADDVRPYDRGNTAGDWIFHVPERPLPGRVDPRMAERASWRLTLLDVGTFQFAEFEGRFIRWIDGTDALCFEAVRPAAASVLQTGGPLAWRVDYRLDGRAVARVRGRLVAPPGRAR